MAFENQTNNLSSLFKDTNKKLNFVEKSSSDLSDLIKSLNIIDPSQLSKKQLSIILQRIDDYNGFYTTQQLENINYLNFNEHVFFDSAVSKVTYAFDRIQNIPYDQDELENIKYFNKTDGFTNYLLKNVFPASKGYIDFDDNNFVVVYDEQGKILSDTNDRKKGLLNPQNKSFSFDFWLKPSSLNINSRAIFHKINRNGNNVENGYFCYIKDIANSAKFELHFCIYIDGSFIDEYIEISESVWQHIAINVSNKRENDDQITKKIDFILNGNIEKSTAINANTLQNKSFNESFKSHDIPFVIGGVFIPEGSSIVNTITHNTPISGDFIGCIDEFRYFQKTRSNKTVKKEMHKNIYAQKGLRLYLRFNEPAGNYTNSFLCIDHSGNKLHGILYNIAESSISIQTNTTGIKINSNTPLRLEKPEDSPVLNSAYTDTVTIRNNLINRAKDYDRNNPNLIFNLMPKHYFLDSASLQDLPVFSNSDAYTSSNNVSISQEGGAPPTISPENKAKLTATLPANNDLVNIVMIWARFFDKLKMYISSITNLLNVNYDTINEKKVIGMQIPILCKMYGIEFKEILPSITKNKLNNENLNFDDIVSEMSIRKIQNILWKRFLINTQDFLRSKGTVRSVESAFNAFGIDYKKLIDIKESSYDNVIKPSDNFKFREDNFFTIDFSNPQNLNKTPDFTGISQGYATNKLFLEVSNIRQKSDNNFNQSKTSIGTNGNTSTVNGLGEDWSIELFFNYKEIINKIEELNQNKTNQTFESNKKYNTNQYLFTVNTANGAVVTVKYSKNKAYNYEKGIIIINVQPILNDASFNRTITLTDVNLYNAPKYFCLTQKKSGNVLTYNATISDLGDQTISDNKKSLSSNIEVTDLSDKISNNNYAFKSNQAISLHIGDFKYNNNSVLLNSIITDNAVFEGEILKIRLWNKALSSNEIISHHKDIENFGVENNKPLNNIISDFKVKNINFAPDPEANSVNTLNIEDVSNNKFYEDSVLKPINSCKVRAKSPAFSDSNTVKNISIISKYTNPNFDEANSSSYVNIISYKDDSNKELKDNFNEFPSNTMPYYFNYRNTNRVSVDMSIVKVINSDISKIISNVDEFTQKVSNNQSKFEYTYKSLDSLREEYFDKFDDANYINYNSLGNIFKYFDNIMSSILHDIIPSRVRFEGFNFVYESHILERHKYEHKNRDSINTISPSIVISDGNNADSFINFSRQKIKSRRNINYSRDRFRSSKLRS